jgi:hypothetical protein
MRKTLSVIICFFTICLSAGIALLFVGAKNLSLRADTIDLLNGIKIGYYDNRLISYDNRKEIIVGTATGTETGTKKGFTAYMNANGEDKGKIYTGYDGFAAYEGVRGTFLIELPAGKNLVAIQNGSVSESMRVEYLPHVSNDLPVNMGGGLVGERTPQERFEKARVTYAGALNSITKKEEEYDEANTAYTTYYTNVLTSHPNVPPTDVEQEQIDKLKALLDLAKKNLDDAVKAKNDLFYKVLAFRQEGRQDYPDEDGPAGITAEFTFENFGVYNFTICYQNGNNTPVITTQFAMVVRRELPTFDTRNTINGIKDSLAVKSELIKKDTLLTFYPNLLGGRNVKTSVEFKTKDATVTYVNGENTLPSFLEIRSFLTREEAKDTMPQVQIGRKIRSDGSLAPIVYGDYEITFQLTYAGFDNVRIDGTLSRATDNTPSATMTVKLTFAKPAKKGMSPWIVLVICAAILGGLGGAWYLSNKFALAVQVHDIKKRNERELKARAQREANLEQMRKSMSNYNPGAEPEAPEK